MKISQLTVESFKVGEAANTIYDDSLITDVVFSGVSDNLKNNKWCIVFGNSVQVDERVKTVIQKYREGRFEKIILCGGTGGISNPLENDNDVEIIDIEKLLMLDNKFICIKLLEDKYLKKILNCEKLTIKMIINDKEEIVDVIEY